MMEGGAKARKRELVVLVRGLRIRCASSTVVIRRCRDLGPYAMAHAMPRLERHTGIQ